MIEHTFQVLEYHRLLSILSRYASGPLGEADSKALNPSSDPGHIDHELRLVAEMRLLLKAKGFVSLADVTDVLPVLRSAGAEGAAVEPAELLAVQRLAEACRESRGWIVSGGELCPGLADVVSGMPVLAELIRSIKAAVAPNATIKDSASPALKRIREKKIQLRLDLQKKLEALCRSVGTVPDSQDPLVTVREGRYVVALRTDFKSRVEGVIHDYSQTRATCFMEPLSALPDNNRLAELVQEEKAEERRVLEQLTAEVREKSAELRRGQALIGRLDGLCARARFAEALSCIRPEIGVEFDVQLKGALNPILLSLALERRERGEDAPLPVAVDIDLERDRNVLLISGPNRGGKTVTLKTLGLLSLMAQSGLHLPVREGSRLPVFESILADIGDEQDLEAGQSTFSAHAGHLRGILDGGHRRSLVIIDEPGGGTDPNEGAAMAMAVLDHLCRRGAWVAVSTHLNRLKSYGLLNSRVKNAAVEFDEDRRRPTFRLQYGSPGISHALDVARDMGLPAEILDRARGYLEQDEVQLNRLIAKLNRLIVESGQEKERAERAKRSYRSAMRKVGKRLSALEEQQQELLAGQRLEAEAAIRQAREEFRQAINLLKERPRQTQSQVAAAQDRIGRELLERLRGEAPGQAEPAELKPGQWVRHCTLKQEGRVETVDVQAGRAQVLLGRVKVSSDLADLEAAAERPVESAATETTRAAWRYAEPAAKELNVIGFRVEEALPLIDRTIDRALVVGEAGLRIIHGYGTGRLREAIRSHLRALPHVRNFTGGDARSGGEAITEVELS